jgi:hypothetical protein
VRAYHDREEPRAQPAASRHAIAFTEPAWRSAATALWVDCSILDSPKQLGMNRSGTCTRGLRTCNGERVTLTNSASSPRVCLCP